jgi:leucyl/phenylalanyl-tRNA--protein transferase
MARPNDILDPATLLGAYMRGVFPMADEWGHVDWYTADPRGILEHDNLRVSRSLRSVIRRGLFAVRFDTAFERVMRGCAALRQGDDGTWISEEFVRAYAILHRHGFAHSVEAWQDGELVGGLYGVSIGAAFMGESMFARVANASKVCLVALVEHLSARGYLLHDTQMVTPHMASMGATLISSPAYLERLQNALTVRCTFE